MASTARCEEDEKEFFDTPEELEKKVTQLAEIVRNSKHFIAFTGAGISTSAGIPDYRSGINTKLDTGAGKWALEAAAQKGIKVEDETKKKWLPKKTGRVVKAVPTITHMTLVKLAQCGKLKQLISQNTDGLHRKSGIVIDVLSELHGNGNLEVCGKCGKQYLRDYRCRNRKIALTVNEKRRKMDPKSEPFGRRKHWTGRFCSVGECEGKLYDTIINFSENLPQDILATAESHTQKADVCLAMGSSLTVTPAADMPQAVGQKKNGHLIIVNIQKTPLDDLCSVRIFGKTDQVCEMLMKKLDIEVPQWRLERYLRIDVQKMIGVKRSIKIIGVDRDGTRYDIINKAKLIVGQEEIIEKSKNDNLALQQCLFKTKSWYNPETQISETLLLKLGFMGHYHEPNLEICLNDFLLGDGDQTIILNLTYNPFDKQWVVKDSKEQKKDFYVQSIYKALNVDISGKETDNNMDTDEKVNN